MTEMTCMVWWQHMTKYIFVDHICPGNGLSPVQHWAITRTNETYKLEIKYDNFCKVFKPPFSMFILLGHRQVQTTFWERPQQIGYNFAGIFKLIFFNENIRILNQNSLKFVLEGPSDKKKTSLVQIMAWCHTDNKPIAWSNDDQVRYIHVYIHICICMTQPQYDRQWVIIDFEHSFSPQMLSKSMLIYH